MVLEVLFNPFKVKRRPLHMFFIGLIYSFIALFLSYFVFRSAAGLLTVFLIVLSTLPILYTTIKNEEELDLKFVKESKLLKEHTKVLFFFMSLFLGIMIALTISYIFLPSTMVDQIFTLQHAAIGEVNANVSPSPTGEAVSSGSLLGNIFINNFKVLFFCLVFSFLYGTGAIFILTWNASVVAAAMGSFVKNELARAASLVGFTSFYTYLGAATSGFFRYMTHGILEIAAYFVAGLAGGIISVALIKHNLKESKVLIDSLDLILISVGLLFLGGIVEVYVTPALF